jgi:thiamine-monophosphate kinase
MNEFDLIAQLIPGLATNEFVVTGAGDDCAVLELGGPDQFLLFKIDAVVEGVHFDASASPEQIGHKALGRCLSDVAAMAGTPIAALVSIGLPKPVEVDFVQRIYSGVNDLARRHRVAIAGGETTASNGGLFISVAAVGSVPKTKCVRRCGARTGDGIFVSGELGGSGSGRHLVFEPRLEEAQWLAEHFKIHSMIDISDGLAGDLRHILKASGVGAELLSSAIPVSRAAKLKARSESQAKSPLLAALTDGEDFELLFTAAASEAVRLTDAWRKQFPKVKLSCIGKIVDGAGLKIRNKTGVRDLAEKGYEHFA